MEIFTLLAVACLPLALALGSLIIESRRGVMKTRLGLDGPIVEIGPVVPDRTFIVAGILLRVTGMMAVGNLYAKMLSQAGHRGRLAPGIYIAVKLAVMIVLVGAFHLGVEVRTPGTKPYLMVLLGMITWAATDYILLQMVKARIGKIQRNIPFWLDLHSTLVEGGLGLDAALAVIVEETRHSKEPLFSELRLLHRDLMLGQDRIGSYRNFAARTAAIELNHVVAAVIQAQQLGAGMIDTLRAQADMMRNKIWEQANQRAEKLPIKLLFPTAFGILPSMFVVTAVPGLLHIVEFLKRAK